ncbi:hypothetical protein [Streptomyces sp. NBC_00203]|uniref:hypothetical protein n=1 Tax=Streptomyces sp. NBC_00203 TaxID=2975680 RepID=UPI003863A854
MIIPYLAAGTEQLRFGSGGVMLPHHAALSIAEQVSLPEAPSGDSMAKARCGS